MWPAEDLIFTQENPLQVVVFPPHALRGLFHRLLKGDNIRTKGIFNFIFHKPKGEESERILGEWTNRDYEVINPAYIRKTQVAKLYEEYFDILEFEMSTFN